MSPVASLNYDPAYGWRLYVRGNWSGFQLLGFRRRVDAIAFAARRGIRIEP